MVGLFKFGVIVDGSINTYMTTYKSPLVSCIHCREIKSAKGIFTHYLISHTTDGKQQNTKQLQESAHLGGAYQIKQKLNNITQYNTSPNQCQYCQTNLDYEIRHNKFCSQSCSGYYSNKMMSPEKQQSRILAKTGQIPWNKGCQKYCKISFCVICNNLIKNKYIKTCSATCKSVLLSNNITERIILNKRSNFRRDKRSYMEESFEQWLSLHNITDFIPEHSIRNHITNRWYFVDFYFPKLNLIVELDGKQHLVPKHIAADILRDEYITTNTKNTIFRISYDEYKNGVKISDLLKLLVPAR